MNTMRALAGTAIMASALAGVVVGQVTERREPFVEPERRFEGVIQTRIDGKPATVQVDYRIWSIGPGVRLERLSLPAGSDVVYELHSGKLTTRVGDRATERRPGSFWTVNATETQSVETHDDTVILRTIAVTRR